MQTQNQHRRIDPVEQKMSIMPTNSVSPSDLSSVLESFDSVYGPVDSWRYGRSLGIDPIGPISTCSFDCVYCQLGEIERKTLERRLFIPTAKIIQELQAFAPWEVDVITLSGSGEPTQALNLGEILQQAKELSGRSLGVLTNGSLLSDPQVRQELAIADQVAVKLDAMSEEGLQRIDRPVAGITLSAITEGIRRLGQSYRGQLAIQTMVLSVWRDRDISAYLDLLKTLPIAEVQLNTPTRPRPLTHQLDARGNHSPDGRDYPVQTLKPVRQRSTV